MDLHGWLITAGIVAVGIGIMFLSLGWATAYGNHLNRTKQTGSPFGYDKAEIEFYPILVCILFTPLMLLLLCVVGRWWRFGWTLTAEDPPSLWK